MADTLYGVTMQEHGVSKIVSARFQKTEREEDAVGDRETKPLKSRDLSTKPTKTKDAAKSSSEDNDGDNDGEDVITMGK